MNAAKVRVRNRFGDKARGRVAAGAALLDRIAPGWWRHVRSRKLDLADACNCITGQLFGDYSDGLDALNLDTAEAREYGFDTRDGDSGGFWTLNRAWREEIRKRRAGAKVGRQ